MFCGRFTHYRYQLEVHNDVGFSTGEMVNAVTMAGIPHHRPSLSAYVINHTAVQVNWTQPSKNNLSYSNRIDIPMVFFNDCELLKQMKTHCLFICSSFVMLSFSSFAGLTGRGGVLLSFSRGCPVLSKPDFAPQDCLHNHKWPLAQHHLPSFITSVQWCP